jgi:uncharacterized cupredoxin-like copper-binding protein
LKEKIMRLLKQFIVVLSAGMVFAAPATSALCATIIKVDLWDKGSGTPMATDLAYGTAGADLSKATMGIKLSRASAPPGIVSFKVTNVSKDTIHEMIVMQLADPTKALPYIANESRVDEDKAGDKGEVSELEPGQAGSLTLALRPGKYLLICNVPGHYAAGMWTEFAVTK